MPPIEVVLLIASVLALVSILASKVSRLLGVPALLLFIVIGMVAGSDGPGGIYFDDARLAQALGVTALALILFSGGLDTQWAPVRPVWRSGLSLATLGVVVTALLVGAFADLAFGFSWLEGLLLGAIVSSTDAAAVFSVLRSRSVRLSGSLEPLLEFESGSNDPMAVFLTLGMIQLLLNPAQSLLSLIPFFIQQMGLGALLGLAAGRLSVIVLNRIKLEAQGLYPVLSLTLALLTYGLTASLGGNGFLAVYLAGLILGNSDFIHKRSLTHFHDGLAWLMQIVMFLTLGLLVFPSRLPAVIGPGLGLAAFLILVARPASVVLALALSKLDWREKTMVAWVGLRGAAPIILATFPLLAGIPKSELIFNLVFFIVLVSVLLQGTTIPLVAGWLGVGKPAVQPAGAPLELTSVAGPESRLVELTVAPGTAAVNRQIVELGLPPGALIVMVCKGEQNIIPTGALVLEAGDRVMMLADSASLAEARQKIESDRGTETAADRLQIADEGPPTTDS
ncbi:MAG: potassium/proton antiporter [Anaerolineales bacterium]|nr:potassium/proton antiporter [Anaerolineales bacterium]